MTQKTVEEKENFEYQAEMSQLLHLIIHSLYSHKDIFLRELISNSCDALSKVRVEELTNKEILDAETELKIILDINEAEKTLTIEDNGIGMSKEDLKNNLGTIAKSGTLEFVKNLKESGKSLEDSNLIGQFGVGFYSAFMVCDEVIVESRHMSKDSQGYRWQSTGSGSYSIEQIEKETRGTKIIIKLNDKGEEFATKTSIESIVKKYSDFVPFPVYLEQNVINKSKAIWHKTQKDTTEEERNEFYKYISNDFENPSGFKFLNIEGKVMFKSLYFIPSKAPMQLYREQEDNNIHLYVNRVFIQDDCKELVPQYLRFVKGVVDTESLPLNVSREVTQNSPVMKKISDILVNNIFKQLESWADKKQEDYLAFYKEFGPILKEGLHYDFERKERILNLLRFETTTLDAGKVTSLKEYISRMRSDQKEIYYIFGTDRDSILKNPNLEYCNKKGIEVLLLTDPIDEFLLPSVGSFEEKLIQSVTKANFDSDEKAEEKKDGLGEADSKDLIEKIKTVLGEKIADARVSNRLIDSPATLVPADGGMDANMERMMKMMNKDFQGTKMIFEINDSNGIIKNLSAKHKVLPDNPVINEVIEHLYETALLFTGELKNVGDYLTRTHTILEKVTSL